MIIARSAGHGGQFAEEMRGRYMAVAGLSWGMAFAVGPYFAGILMDGSNPNWLWYACGMMGMLAAFGYLE
jgi:MFS family permease